MAKNHKNPATEIKETGNPEVVENVIILAVYKKLDSFSGFILNHFLEIEKNELGKWMLENLHEN